MIVRRLGVLPLALALAVTPAAGQKSGGTLRIYNSSNSPGASPHEDTTIAAVMPFMAVYNNLVRYDPIKSRNSFDTIIPELATSWEWDVTKTKVIKLCSDVVWHDGKPFTGKDVQCTFHRLKGKEPEYLRRNPRGMWYEHLTEVTLNGDYEVTFNLSQPHPRCWRCWPRVTQPSIRATSRAATCASACEDADAADGDRGALSPPAHHQT